MQAAAGASTAMASCPPIETGAAVGLGAANGAPHASAQATPCMPSQRRHAACSCPPPATRPRLLRRGRSPCGACQAMRGPLRWTTACSRLLHPRAADASCAPDATCRAHRMARRAPPPSKRAAPRPQPMPTCAAPRRVQWVQATRVPPRPQMTRLVHPSHLSACREARHVPPSQPRAATRTETAEPRPDGTGRNAGRAQSWQQRSICTGLWHAWSRSRPCGRRRRWSAGQQHQHTHVVAGVEQSTSKRAASERTWERRSSAARREHHSSAGQRGGQ